MKIVYANNILTVPSNEPTNIVCVTTNGMCKRNGDAVMGAGIAKYINDTFHVATKLGEHLRQHGNCCADLGQHKYGDHQFTIVSFPTKRDWRDNSDIELIRTSANQLVAIMDEKQYQHCYLTPPGCANGHLQWSDVKAVIEPILDDRFTVVIRPNERYRFTN